MICIFLLRKNHEYTGLVKNVDIYAVTENAPWGLWGDPEPMAWGTKANPHPEWPHKNIDADTARAEQVPKKVNIKLYANQQNVIRAVIEATNAAVPKSYRQA